MTRVPLPPTDSAPRAAAAVIVTTRVQRMSSVTRRLVNVTATTTRTAANVTSAAPDSGTSLTASSVSVTGMPTRVTPTLARVLTARMTQSENFVDVVKLATMATPSSVPTRCRADPVPALT